MGVVYVIQVLAYHGGGLQGWRTVRKPGGEAYSFDSYEDAQAALRRHFSNLREGVNVRIATLDEEVARQVLQVEPTDASAGNP